MKLASLKSGRDGRLIVVSRDLLTYVEAHAIVPTLQGALDRWEEVKDSLEALYQSVNQTDCRSALPLDITRLHSPLPRAFQWADGSAYVNHVELVRKARGAELPPSFWTDPLMYQGGSDDFLAPTDPIVARNEEHGIDFEAEIAVVTGDVEMGVDKETAAKSIRLFMLVNDVSLRNLIPQELAKGFGFFQSKPSSSFGPIAVTPDELGTHFRDFKVHLPLTTHFNGSLFGSPNAGVDMTFDFADLIAHAASTRRLRAGTIIGSGTVSNVDRSSGSSCIAERRMLETLADGKASTPFMKHGDRVRIELFLPEGQSVFGAIDQEVVVQSC